MARKFYLTTAITYTSGKPHIGNTYEIILSDSICRFKRMQGYDVFFMTGTDEHGQKVEDKAKKAGLTPKEFVDIQVAEIKRLWRLMDISYDKFIRTTDDYHERAVQKIFKKFYQNGDIYKGSYKGMYCTPCESFWAESQLKDGKCPDCGREVKPAEEEAYFFAMGKYADRLVKHILTHPSFVCPTSRKNEMMNNFLLADEFIGKSDEEILAAAENGTLKTKLQDLCVSRTSFKWGIPVDFDSKHVVYVWLDALNNYITGIGYDTENPSELYKKLWPADVHVIGKDIIRFHTIYWPIFLMALGEPLPEKVFGHPWLLQGGDKMSKSRGNVLYADDLASVFGADAVRYFSLHEMPYADDGVITWELMCERVNSDLANTLGNLVKRTAAMVNKYFGGTVKKVGKEQDIDLDLGKCALSAVEGCADKMEEYKVADALDALFGLFRRANKYIDETEPWILARDEGKKERLERVLYNLLAAIDMGANCLAPFMPSTSDKILKETGATKKGYAENLNFASAESYTVSPSPETLFERLNFEDIKPKIEEIERAQRGEAEPVCEPLLPEITIDDFAKIDMRVGLITACEAVKKSKLLHETVKVGDRTLSVLSGIAQYYTPEELVGKKVVVVVNLPPRVMKGITSEGMIVCAEKDGKLSIISPERDLPDGSRLS